MPKDLSLIKNDCKSQFQVSYAGNGDVRSFVISRAHKFCADVFIQTGSISNCRKEMIRKYNIDLPGNTIKKWLDETGCKAYIIERLRDLGFANTYTRERWMRELVEYKDGVRQADEHTKDFMKMLGMAVGAGDGGSVNNQNVLIQLNQGDGRP